MTLTEADIARPIGDQTAGKVLILACGALAHEVVALKKANGWDHLDLQCLPAVYHNHPEKIVPAVEEAVAKYDKDYAKIFLAYADCGTGGGLERAAQRLGVEMIAGPHCYSFLEGVDAFASRGDDDMTAFFLTDFLVRQFDAFVWTPLGLDRHPELRDMYFAHYRTLIYQAQTDDPALDAKAADCAKRLGLAYERRLVGYGDLETSLGRL
ncbi:MAG: DUF1638 domain-containing protein [Pseudomonadota bacterium]